MDGVISLQLLIFYFDYLEIIGHSIRIVRLSMTAPTQVSTATHQTHRHHRLSFVCVNDVYSFDDVDSSNTPNNPRGGWCRAATLMKQLVRQKKQQGEKIDVAAVTTVGATALDHHDDDHDNKFDETNASSTTVLAVVNGDVLGGSSLLQSRQGSIAIEVMNSIPIDLAVLGNHEFDHGDEILMQRVRESNFVWLGSNVYYPLYSSDGNDEEGDDDNLYKQEKVVRNCYSETKRGNDDIATDHFHHHHYFPGIHGNGKLYTLHGSDIKIGVFGLVTKVTPLISYPSKKVTFDPDILSVARRVTRSLRAQGAQIIVAITHLSEEEDRLLAMDSIAGVDLILGGHEHEPLAIMVHRNQQCDGENDDEQNNAAQHESKNDGSPVEENNIAHQEKANQDRNEGGVLVFKCGMNAYWVGSVDLDIISGESGTVTSISTSWSMEAVNSRTAEDVTVSKIVKSHRTEAEASALISNFGESVASTIHLDDVVAIIGEKITHHNTNGHNSNVATTSAILPLDTRMSSVRRREATGGNLIADAMLWMLQTNICDGNNNNDSASLPMLAMINGGFIRGDTLYQPGFAFTVRDVLKELPFPHTMKVLEIEGIYLKKAMLQQLKGSSKGPTGAYPHLSSNASLSYGHGGDSFSSSDSKKNSDGEKFSIHSFTVNGMQVQDEQKYLIAVTTFVANGNEGCTAWLQGKQIENSAWTGVNMSCVLLKYLQCHGAIYPVLEGRVSLHK